MKTFMLALVSLLWLGLLSAAEAPVQIMVAARFKERTKTGEDVLSAPRVTMLSGGQAQVRVVNALHILGVGTNDKTWHKAAAGPVWTTVETGLTFDLLPVLKGGAIEYGGVLTIREFLGYDGDAKDPAASFVTRELRFFGTAKNGEAKALKLKGGGKAKDVEVQLTFTLLKADGSPAAP
ncbi:MAG: hypothetical protein EXS29_06950 [Pedosphaera sp.]|nr:hypothetical protein [Pedosphaera sp.]